MKRLTLFLAGLFIVLQQGAARAELTHAGLHPFASNVIVPQARSQVMAIDHGRVIRLVSVKALVDILETTATTTLEFEIENTDNRRQEAELLIPVPDSVVVKGFAYSGPGGMITAEVLSKDDARRIYEQLVSKIRDPALVEFDGSQLVRSSVFPVEPRSKTQVRLTYEHLLSVAGPRVDYVMPRSESLDYCVPWTITASIKSKRPVCAVYSASHKLQLDRISDRSVKAIIDTDSMTEPGPLRLSFMLDSADVSASMFAYPDPKVGGGYFLLLGGVPSDSNKSADVIKRELTIVIDRSGSMGGNKIKQVKEAAMQIIGGLSEGEAFNVLIYNDDVEKFAAAPVTKKEETESAARRYIDGITASGGTNLHEALSEALAQAPAKRLIPIIIFLTDGQPTVGNTSEQAIASLVTGSNPFNRRVFTFGVGTDLNAPLLDKIASASRARSTFALPEENVEAKVGLLFKKLTGPILADVELQVVMPSGSVALGRTRDILPAKIPDIFADDQVILLGQYVGTEPLIFKLSGNYRGTVRTFQFTFDFDSANCKNGFVPRLWASRKIAALIETVRQCGSGKPSDPNTKELVDEIVRLSTQFGILTEYTAFLAREGTDFADRAVISRETDNKLYSRAVKDRVGLGAVSQSLNMAKAAAPAATLNGRNEYYDENMQRVSISSVQQSNERAYYRKGNIWMDSSVVDKDQKRKPDHTIEFGSKEYFTLADKLAATSRQSILAAGQDTMLMLDGELILVKSPR